MKTASEKNENVSIVRRDGVDAWRMEAPMVVMNAVVLPFPETKHPDRSGSCDFPLALDEDCFRE
ncbi:hypothetical protein RSAG8_00487, partial [Rhizoctonia solani AG-8 WAC10335]